MAEPLPSSWPATDGPSVCPCPAAGRSAFHRRARRPFHRPAGLRRRPAPRPLAAATAAPGAVTAAPAASAAKAAPAAKAEPAAQVAVGSRNSLLAPDGGICSVPVLGDLGGLVNLCNAGIAAWAAS